MCCFVFELLQYLSHEVSCGFYRQALCLLYTADAGLQDKPGVAMFQHEGEPKRQDQSFLGFRLLLFHGRALIFC